MPGQVEAVMLGAGNRGFFAYGPAALARPEELRFTVVVEPDPGRRRRFGAEHHIPPERQLASAGELWAAGRLAEALFNCTPDDQHFQTTRRALEQDYQVMLEKPMATTADEGRRLVELAERRGAILVVAHVLRYTPFFSSCVYHCDNDVVDHQVVALEFESGASGVLTMQGHSHEEARTMRYDGTRATLRGRFHKLRGNHLEIHRHRDGRARELLPDSGHDDHGGGDTGLVRAFVRAVWRARQGASATDATDVVASARDCLQGHLLAFAAEESRMRGQVVALRGPHEIWS